MLEARIEPQTLWRRYVFALVLIAGFLITSHVMALLALSGGEEGSTAINISGRQRMLSQRVLALKEREIAEPNNRAFTAALDTSIDLFVRSHKALSEGGEFGLTTEGAENRRWIYETERDGQTLNQEVANFVEQLQVLRGKARGDQEAARAFLSDLEATDGFLLALDLAVRDLEAQAAADVNLMRRLSTLGLIAALIILILEARFIFWPAQRAVASAFHEVMASLDAAEAAREKVKRVLRARTAFFANMSEDLQTPLRILRDYVDRILLSELPGTVGRQLALVQRASQQMEQIINDVLDVRLLEEGLVEIQEEPLELTKLIEKTTDFYRQKAERKGIRFDISVAPEIPSWIWADPKRLSQIIDNLVSNAVKHTHEGSVTVRAGTFRGGRWALEVVDTGEGISFTSQDELFRRFVKKPGEPGRSTGGTGLGLPICHDLARLMDGQLSVESVLGHGSTFRAVLPLKLAEAPHQLNAAVDAA